jgi:hypothetical protein
MKKQKVTVMLQNCYEEVKGMILAIQGLVRKKVLVGKKVNRAWVSGGDEILESRSCRSSPRK